ncbi:hypothetical protein QJS10_CPB15g00814 [Acorus calamus]|uniref:Uncharacterized protein n=1 Tax=Acorus calamus TaxID=4465 RepID=A0AAV9D4W9_ACOCL|nr:hypothetical protein QJS10_CPB15g00814 [Acorus calamus]
MKLLQPHQTLARSETEEPRIEQPSIRNRLFVAVKTPLFVTMKAPLFVALKIGECLCVERTREQQREKLEERLGEPQRENKPKP